MKSKIQRWGNSLALRIPKSFAVDAHLEQDTLVELSLVDGKLIVAPVPAPPPGLEELLAAVTDQNLHKEVEFGPALGAEAW